MAKRKINKPTNKETKEKEKKDIKKQNIKNYVAFGKSKLIKSKKADSIYQKRKKSDRKSSFNDSANIKIRVLLPKELLEKAKNILREKESGYLFKKGLKIYDINDEINYRYLRQLKMLSKGDYKYIYTLSFDNRKTIPTLFKIDKVAIFAHSSKQLFYEFVNILLEKEIALDKELSMKKLEDYKVDNFDKFIIPINEGTEELKYYYFMNIIWGWINGIYKKSVPKCLKKFKSFFKCKNNLNKINEVFYVLFRIDLLFIYCKVGDLSSLSSENLMVNETD